MKKDTFHILISTGICFVFSIIGFVLGNKLNLTFPIAFDENGNPTLFSSKLFIILGIPIILAFINLVVHYVLNSNPKKEEKNKRLRLMIKYIIPVFSNILLLIIYLSVLGFSIEQTSLINLIIGLFLIFIGLFLFGEKNDLLKHALLRLGKSKELKTQFYLFLRTTFVCGGIALLANAFFIKNLFIVYIVLATIFILSIIYFYYLFRKN